LIELKECVLKFQMRWSSFNPHICNNIEVQKILKGRFYDFNFFSKKHEFLFCKDMYTIKIISVAAQSPYVNAMNLAGVQNRERIRLVESKRGDGTITSDYFKLMNRINHFGNMCTLRNSNRWDISLTSISNDTYFLINACKQIRSSVLSQLQLDERAAN
jgi:hypothetical protein